MEWIGDLERVFAASIYPNRVPIAVAAAAILVGLAIVGRRRGWGGRARRHPRATAVSVLLAVAIAAPVGWYLASPLVLSTTIDEPAPVAAAERTAPLAATVAPPPTASAAASARPSATPSPSPTPPPLELAGGFAGADDFHFGRGTAHLIETSPGTFVVRLEDFAVRNGPDLYVYLSPNPTGYDDGVIELGRLKADKGNQNYAVPAGLDPASAASVVIWCKQFSVQFAVAALEPAA